jgi:hypothetical protein
MGLGRIGVLGLNLQNCSREGLLDTPIGQLGFELRASCLLGRHSTTCASLLALFCIGYFQDMVLWTISLGWLQTMILLIFASWVARITVVVSHQHSAFGPFFHLSFLLAMSPARVTFCPHLLAWLTSVHPWDLSYEVTSSRNFYLTPTSKSCSCVSFMCWQHPIRSFHCIHPPVL